MAVKKINSYEVLDTLGIGGMGQVFKVRHTFNGGIFAIKSLHIQYCTDPEFRKRFENEAQILNKLNHPNIVKVHDFFEFEGGLYFVMDYVDGKPLSRIIGQEVGPIVSEKAIPMFSQILAGMRHAHEQGVIHRDLKPSNILVTPDGKIKITDFGIAKADDGGKFTRTGTKMGTLSYMSPEQVIGKGVDNRSDIYSLGITLYEMLAGKLPFKYDKDTSDFEMMNRIINEPLPDPREHYPYIPEKYVDIVKHATKKKQEERIQTIEEFERLLGAESVEVSSAYKRKTAKFSPYELGDLATQKIDLSETPTKVDSDQIYEDLRVEQLATLLIKRKKKKKIMFGVLGIFLFVYIAIFTLLKPSKTDVTTNNIKSKLVQIEEPNPTNLPEMVFVKGGTFKMGSNDYDNEKPIHTVTVNDFYIGKYEVTQKEWEEVMRNNPSGFKGANRPVENVSWNDIQEFLKKLNEKSAKGGHAGKKYRLPTEAEWEYAAKGGNQSKGYKYSGRTNISEVAWYDGNSSSQTHEVGQKQPNELGIYDMTGNVWEWCSDWYDNNYYKSSPSKNPQGASSGEFRVLRGGSWSDDDSDCRSSVRGWYYPDIRGLNNGFRLAQE